MAERERGRFVLHVFLFVVTAVSMLFAFGVLSLFTSLLLWLIVPPGLVYGVFISMSLVLFGILFCLADRKRCAWLKAISLGGTSLPGLLVVLLLLNPVLPKSPRDQRPNQQESVASPSGRYVLTVPIERSQREKGPLGYGMPYWHVTISDPNGTTLYRDDGDRFVGIRNIYWVWDEGDRVWLYDSDDGGVYVYECADRVWGRDLWGHGRVGHVPRDIAPPPSLYPSYVPPGPVQNLGTPWTLSGFMRDSEPGTEAAVMFRNTQTGELMMLREGESKQSIMLAEVDWDTKRVIVEIAGERFTLSMLHR